MSLFSNVLGQSRARLVPAGIFVAAALVSAGCGSSYRPVITPSNPTGPASQPISYAVVISSPSSSSAGVATVLDYSGDSILAQAPIGPNPSTFTLDASGSTGYTVNSDKTLTNFTASATEPQEKDIHYSTLPAGAQVVGLFSPTARLWAADLNGNVIDVLEISGAAQAFKLAIPVAPTPIAVVGLGTPRVFSISQNSANTPAGSILPFGVTCNNSPHSVTQTGEADALEVATFTVSNRIPLGACPVYGVMTSDARRTFVLNRGSDTVTVIDSQNNSLDNRCPPPTGCVNQSGQTYFSHPELPLSTTAVTATGITPPNGTTGFPALAGPVYAEYIPATQQLVVADYDGSTISLIDVSLDQYGNDSQTFGTTFTIPVGKNPASVTALADGSRAYTADQSGGSQSGSVTVVNLTSHTVKTTLNVTGHPRTVVSTSNSLYGKVYVAAPDSKDILTIIRTDQDIVDTTVLIEGSIVDVRTTTQKGSGGNANINSRIPGGGQPCYVPGTEGSLAACQTLP